VSDHVGYSDKRTPAKHRILFAHAGRDIGAAKYAAPMLFRTPPYTGHLIIDLTAGDAVCDYNSAWERGSSPAIFSLLAAQHPNVRVRLYEINPSTFDRLITNLSAHLPELGYEQITDQSWRHRRQGSVVDALREDGSQEIFADLRPGEWLYVSNDPNNMAGWTLNMQRFVELRQTRIAMFMSTMGCNSGGLKRLERPRRDIWFDHIRKAERLIAGAGWLDLVLFEILKDAAQWAYLQLVPRKWTQGTIKDMSRRFQKEQLEVAAFSFQEHPSEFADVCERLFLTKEEREEAA
jgi:hypothetical protein